MIGKGTKDRERDMTQANGNPIVFIGTYTQTDSQGIYTCRFDDDTGALEQVSFATGAGNPSFLALHPNKRFLYAASEVHEFDGKEQGAVYAYSVDVESGGLTYLNSRGAGGPGPCHVKVDATGRFVLAANYHGGSVCMLPIEGDGSLAPASDFIQHKGSSVNPRRQDQAHAHSINPDAQNRFAYVPDSGQDRVVIYRLDTENGRTRSERSRLRRGESRDSGRATSTSTPSGTVGLPHKRTRQYHHRFRIRPRNGQPLRVPGYRYATDRILRLEHHGGHTRSPVGQLRLRLEPRTRQHHRLLGGSEQRANHTARTSLD